LQGKTHEEAASGCTVNTSVAERESVMALRHQPPQDARYPELSVRHADLTVRIVLWLTMGLVAVALTLWWFLT
jgi:hypothetical protein